MKQNVQKNPILWIILLVGGGILLGMSLTSRFNRAVSMVESVVPVAPVGRMAPVAGTDAAVQVFPEGLEVRKTVDGVIIEEEVIIRDAEIGVRSERITAPVRPQRPLPPNVIITTDGPDFNHIMRTLFNNLLPVSLILIGVWLIVRQNRKPEEKAP